MTWLLKAVAALGAAMAGYFVGANVVGPMFGTLTLFITLDWITGIRASRHEGKPVESAQLSRTGEKLMNRAVGTLVLWFIGLMLDGNSNTGYALPAAYLGYTIAVEAWSIFENMARCGDALPDFITQRLRKTLEAEGVTGEKGRGSDAEASG